MILSFLSNRLRLATFLFVEVLIGKGCAEDHQLPVSDDRGKLLVFVSPMKESAYGRTFVQSQMEHAFNFSAIGAIEDDSLVELATNCAFIEQLGTCTCKIDHSDAKRSKGSAVSGRKKIAKMLLRK